MGPRVAEHDNVSGQGQDQDKEAEGVPGKSKGDTRHCKRGYNPKIHRAM